MLIPSSVAAALPEDALLPDLGMAPLTNFRIERRPRGDRWLRFSTVIVNVGEGPFEVVEYTNPAGRAAGRPARQDRLGVGERTNIRGSTR